MVLWCRQDAYSSCLMCLRQNPFTPPLPAAYSPGKAVRVRSPASPGSGHCLFCSWQPCTQGPAARLAFSESAGTQTRADFCKAQPGLCTVSPVSGPGFPGHLYPAPTDGEQELGASTWREGPSYSAQPGPARRLVLSEAPG